MSDTPTTLATRPEKAPVLAGERGLQFDTLEGMFRFAQAMVNSGQFKDLPSPEVALLKLQAGLELGLTPVWSLTNIFVVNGKPTVYGDALLGIVLARPDCEDVIETADGKFPEDSFTAMCEVKRKGRLPVRREFSIADAKKAGLFGKSGPWSQYPRRMLAMRARSFACRDAFADALRGFAFKEEQDDIPKQVQARVVTTKLELPEEPTHATVEQKVSDNAAGEHLEHLAAEKAASEELF